MDNTEKNGQMVKKLDAWALSYAGLFRHILFYWSLIFLTRISVNKSLAVFISPNTVLSRYY